MQKLILTGRLGRDPEVRKSQNSSDEYVTFTVATNSRSKGVEKTTWYDIITTHDNRVKGIVPHLKKGSAVYIVGELDASLYDANDGSKRLRLSVYAESITFNDGTSKNSENNQAQQDNSQQQGVQKTTQKTSQKKEEKKAAPKPPEDIPMFSNNSNNDDSSEEELPF